MDESKWMSVLITALIGSAIVCVLILLINESGKRGQAITWLPGALATTVAVTHISNPNELERLLRTAFSALFISGSFIMSFYMLLNTILPDNPKDITAERQNTILITTIVLALVIPGLIVFLVEEYAHPFWSLILGFVGVGLVIVNVMCSKRLHFKNQTIKLGFKAFCCCHKKISKKEIYMLIGAVIGTFTFVIIPALLSDAGYANWAGIIANAPKVTVLIMVSLWVNRPPAISRSDEIELKHEIREHLTMFSYSTSITGIYIIIMWWNESQKNPENFWWAWTISLLLSLAFITGILVPVCLQSSKPKAEEPQRQPDDKDDELNKLFGKLAPVVSAISGPEIGSRKTASEVLQERLKLKW